MKRILTAVITAIEAGAVALAGLVIVAIPTILLWIITFQLGSEPGEVLSALSAVWLLGHAVPLGFTLDAQSALSFGLAPEALRFTLSLAPLGIGLITAGAGARIGWRLGRRGGAGAVGLPAGLAGFAALTLLPVALAAPLLAAPVWGAVLAPTLFFTLPAVAGFLLRAAHDGHEWWHRALRELHRGIAGLGWRRSPEVIAALADALRLAAATLAVLLALAALGVGVSIVGGYVQVVTLSQHLQLDPIGATAVFILQIAFLPVAVIWALAWFSGSGFAIGAGSSVTPFETLLGPVPALPIFGAIPPAWGTWGSIAILLVVLCAIACGVLFAGRRGAVGALREAGIVLSGAALVGLAVVGLSALATGSIGPDRLDTTGPNPWQAGAFVAAEVAFGLAIGAFAARHDLTRKLARLGRAGAGATGTADVLGASAAQQSPLDPADAADFAPEVTLPYGVARAVQEGALPEIDDAEQVTEDYGASALLPADELDDAAHSGTPVRAALPPQEDGQWAPATPGIEAELQRASEPEPVPAPSTETDPIDEEEALVRAYAWDDASFTGEVLPAPADDHSDEARGRGAMAPWWRQLGERATRRGRKAKASEADGETATDLPTVDLGSDPLARPEQLD